MLILREAGLLALPGCYGARCPVPGIGPAVARQDVPLPGICAVRICFGAILGDLSRMKYFFLLIVPVVAVGFLLGASLSSKKSASAATEASESALAGAEAVVQKQLVALKNNDQPQPDAGIELAWAFAHPSNRKATGPLGRFTQMLKGPTYRDLLNHSAHRITFIDSTPTTATYDVVVFPGSNRAPLLYRWTVARVQSGDREGEWATTAVSAPVDAGLPPA